MDSDTQIRQVVTNGVRLTPNPKLSLVGARNEAILELFGPGIFGAVKTSSTYQRDRQQAIIPTRCILMHPDGDPRLGAAIELNLGLKEGFQIAHQLYSI